MDAINDNNLYLIRKIRTRVKNLTIESDRERTKSFREIIILLDELQASVAAKYNTSK